MSTTDAPRFSMNELVESTGFPARTIRYYIEQGIVPPPRGRGRAAYYSIEHVERLEHVKRLREGRRTHDEIRAAFVRESQPVAATTDVWERTALHPDLELHLRSTAPGHVRELAERLREVASDWFGIHKSD